MQILNRFNKSVIFEANVSSTKELVELAIKSRADLSGADLSGADLSRADLSWTNLSWTDLSGADLSGADLSGADLSRADLSGADLSGADLSRADLSRADLSFTCVRSFTLGKHNFFMWIHKKVIMVKVGCYCLTLKEALKNSSKITKSEKYTIKEMKLYVSIIKLIAKSF
jgi:uncharacterized protein YjbI with pentapeptide repeats